MRLLFRITILLTSFLFACQPLKPTDISPPTVLRELTPSAAETPVTTQTTIVYPSLATATSEEKIKTIELPEWVKRSWTGGLLVLPYRDAAGGRPSKSILVNPDNGDTFIVDLQKEFYHYYWRNNEHVVFFHEGDCKGSPEMISELNVFTSILQVYQAKDHPEYVVSCTPDSGDEIVRINYEHSEATVEFVEPSSGAISFLTNPDDGVTDISIEVSAYEQYVAVVQFDGDFEFPDFRLPVYGNKISIYDLRTQRLVLQYSEEEGILSEVSYISYGNLAYMRGNTPCLIMIVSLSKKCIHNIPNQFPDATIILSEPDYAVGRLGFLYFSQHQGGYCFYNIFAGGIGCPTDYLPAFKNQIIINHSLSPSGNYLLVEYDREGCPVPWCGHADESRVGLINLTNGELFELGASDQYYLGDLFRPLHPDPWRPRSFDEPS
ncbi:MAG TPA: hypothetical protein VFQ13_00675 [Anaerolineales bacterium]|nr:hypothetical protein [Anaerolineales bacterium]